MRIIRRIVKPLIPRRQSFSELEYWKTRVRKFSKRSVLNIYHSDDEIEIVTNKQREEIFPSFQQSLRGDEKSIFDSGCGYGRFTNDLISMLRPLIRSLFFNTKYVSVGIEQSYLSAKVKDLDIESVAEGIRKAVKLCKK